MNKYLLSFLLTGCLALQAMQELPPAYEQQLPPAHSPMVIIEMPSPPEYTEREAPHSRRCSVRFKRNMMFGAAATVLSSLGIFGFIHQGDVTVDTNTFLPFFGALSSLSLGAASAIYICARERYSDRLPIRDCFD